MTFNHTMWRCGGTCVWRDCNFKLTPVVVIWAQKVRYRFVSFAPMHLTQLLFMPAGYVSVCDMLPVCSHVHTYILLWPMNKYYCDECTKRNRKFCWCSMNTLLNCLTSVVFPYNTFNDAERHNGNCQWIIAFGCCPQYIGFEMKQSNVDLKLKSLRFTLLSQSTDCSNSANAQRETRMSSADARHYWNGCIR